LSIERTKSIIDQCLTDYLQSQLDGCQPKPSVLQLLSAGPETGHALLDGNRHSPDRADDRYHTDGHRAIFRALEDYIIDSFTGCDCLNSSFMTTPSSLRVAGEDHPPRVNWEPQSMTNTLDASPAVEPDAKTLLLGDIAENSSWWMGGRAQSQESSDVQMRGRSSGSLQIRPSSRSPRIDWAAVEEWYRLIVGVGESWIEKWLTVKSVETHANDPAISERCNAIEFTTLERDIDEARIHVRQALLKATESLLKRPRRPLRRPDDIRFLLILLANPLLHSSASHQNQWLVPDSSLPGETGRSRSKSRKPAYENNANLSGRRGVSAPSRPTHREPRQHTGIVKRILGLLSNLPNDCHYYLVGWLGRFSENQFEKLVDLIGSFVTYRLTRQHGRQRSEISRPTNSLVPDLSGATRTIPAQLRAALSERSPNKSPASDGRKPVIYNEDWQIGAAARVMSLFFAANNVIPLRKRDSTVHDQKPSSPGLTARLHSRSHGQVIPINSFYNTLLDYSDLVADFEIWESRSSKFSFCQYPFFLSIYAKIRILEYDARRQMVGKAREAFFDSILSRKAVSQFLVLKVRRDCLIEDSLRSVSEVIGSGQEDIKKGLRIEFLGEEGVDAGGLRKEWFLLLVREVFDPNHGMSAGSRTSHSMS
jgi:E3 ubiquitin-protein ligase HECTD2